MRFNVRCRNCRARHKFAKHPDDYVRLPKCRNCGTNLSGFRIENPSRTVTCKCDSVPYPHRKLSSTCAHNNPHFVAADKAKESSFLDGLVFDEVSV